MKQDFKDAERARERWLRSSPAREKIRRQIERSMDDIQEDLKNARAEREKILFMAWVPDLTLRAGAVILLLFLTQVLLSAYRYTLGLSTYYLARADAIQLLQPKAGNATWYDIGELKTLVDNFSPTSISIDAVQSPTDQVADLAKAWISRGPKV